MWPSCCNVPAGPGVIPVGVEADYALDFTGHRWGLLYRRNGAAGRHQQRPARPQALRSAAHVAQLLEAEFPGQLKFSRQ